MQQQQPQPPNRSLILFFVLAFLMYIAWMDLRNRLWPPPKPEPAENAAKDKDASKDRSTLIAAATALSFAQQAQFQQSLGAWAVPDVLCMTNSMSAARGLKAPTSIKPQDVTVSFPPRPTPEKDLIRIGSPTADSDFHLGVAFDRRGAGVRSMVLNKFQAATPEGLPAWEDAARTIKRPLELIPPQRDNDEPSYLLYSFDVRPWEDQDRPLDTLGRINWVLVGNAPKTTTLSDGRKQQTVSFEATLQGALVTKTYTLTEKEYHLGLEVKFKNVSGAKLPFRYQLTGGHALPIEGKWYTQTFRNALIGCVDASDRAYRHLQDIRQINSWEGGDEVRAGTSNPPVHYFGVAVQYFASIISVDDQQAKRDFLAGAQPTLEAMVLKGLVTQMAPDHSSFVLRTEERQERTCFVPPDRRGQFADLEGSKVAIVVRQGSYSPQLKGYPLLALRAEHQDTTHALWENDITVRAVTEKVDLEPGMEASHKYLLYNGPVKVSQLYDRQSVPPELVDRYLDRLHLNTMTDYHSPGVMGGIGYYTGFSWLVIKCTNLMHIVFSWLTTIVPSMGLCIIVLTVLVRSLMLPISRKQQLMTIKMQQMQPEMKKLMEKYKDNRQALAAAQMELYRKHGVNPFGTCWFLLLQMPVFMGLYYALLESIRFRLADFWPLWIQNLAAPDMLWHWGDRIWWISQPEYYGWLFYLGPYLNVLPVIAVGFMLVQQKMMTPPPADDQQAMQMKIMRYMMIFMGLMFYKVAAGLCIYFIASSVWGLMERKLLLPRAKPGATPALAGGPALAIGTTGAQTGSDRTGSTGIQTGGGRRAPSGIQTGAGKRDRGRNRSRPGRGGREAEPEAPPSWWQRLRDWWKRVQEEARKK
jgi:YidC/Oxa1 family membrane protein insertase